MGRSNSSFQGLLSWTFYGMLPVRLSVSNACEICSTPRRELALETKVGNTASSPASAGRRPHEAFQRHRAGLHPSLENFPYLHEGGSINMAFIQHFLVPVGEHLPAPRGPHSLPAYQIALTDSRAC